MRVGIATGHGGFSLIEDFRAYRVDSGGDFPGFVIPLARAAEKKVERGAAARGSGVGASVCATGPFTAWDVLEASLAAEYGPAPRFLRRLQKIAALEPEAARSKA